jgi:DNA-binding response OmpR family regulator
MNSRLLILDDEPAIARVLQPVLTAAGATVFTAGSAVEGLRVAKRMQSIWSFSISGYPTPMERT